MLFDKFASRYTCALLLTLSVLTAFAQPGAAGLLNKWKKAQQAKAYRTDSASVKLLNQLSEEYLYNHTDSGLYFAKQALHLAQLQQYTVGEASAQLNISRNYYVKGDYVSSLNAAARVMDAAAKINYRPGIAGAYQLTGLIYAADNKFGLALDNLKKALDIFISLKDQPKTGKAYFNLGFCYDEMGEHEEALPWLKKAMDIAGTSGNNNLAMMTLNRMGEVNFDLKRYSQALALYQQVIDAKNSSKWETGFALSGIAQASYGLGEYQKAIGYAQKSLAVAQTVNSQSDRIRALMILAESYAAINNFKLAYAWHVQYKNASDSIAGTQKNKEINSLHLSQQQADNQRLVNEIKIKEQYIAFSRRLFWFRNVIALIVVVLVVFIIRSNRQKTALNKVLQKQNAEITQQKAEITRQKETLHKLNRTKDQLFSVISHDLRSPFAAILQTIDGMKAGELTADEQREILTGFYQQVSVVTMMVNNLLAWAGSQQAGDKTNLAALNITAIINEIIGVSNFLARNKRISLVHTFDTEKYVLADLNHVKIIFNNLIGNAIKFTPHGGTIEIFYSCDEDYAAIHVKDNGIGILPQKMERLFKITGKDISGYGTNNEAGAGIGLGLIKQFVDADRGRLEVKSTAGNGSEFIVYLEKADAV